MRELWPTPRDDVDAAAAYTADARPTPPGRPWLLLNMIATVDGAATDTTGLSGGLAGPGDRRVFAALRGVADVVLAGASTVRTERYGPARPSSEVESQRLARGQAARPRVAIVSASLRLDPELRLFREAKPDARPILVTTAEALAADTPLHRRLRSLADLVVAGEGRVDWHAALSTLRSQMGTEVLLVEGGPTINAQLVAADLVDELCLTLSPRLVAGDAPRIIGAGHPSSPRPLSVDRVIVDDDFVFLRYLRAAAATG
ncbi:MAG TPA: dihydrofolate reductase family protein [Acidimicrobiales bacterium]|nr:dihydrofolate reductase family protein [Acidimicrobiales bacterium]